jgi:hypothetical protein
MAKKGMARKMKLGILATLLIIVVVASLVMAQSLTGKVLPNTGNLNPPGQAAGSPLLIVTRDSVYNAIDAGNDTSLLVEITGIPWGNFWGSYSGVLTDTLKILNTSICIFNNGSTVMYPAWSTTGLPTGFSLKCFVLQVEWSPNDYNAFHLPPKELPWASFYGMYFVLSVTNKAIPGPLTFTINFDYSEQPTA